MVYGTRLHIPTFLVVLSAMLLVLTQGALAGNSKYAAIVMNHENGTVLFSRNADKRLHPASLTKVMTLMLTFDAIKRGEISLYDKVKISRRAASMVPSKLGLKPGETITVENAIYALVTKSANDIAVALAEHVGGSEREFVAKMNRKARGIGMRQTTFKNPSGLHDIGQVTSARDMAVMGQFLIKNYPREYEYFSTKEFRYNGYTYRNHNRLMSRYQGMDGLKTGYINASGFNLIASATRQSQRLVGVVFGGRSTRTRDAHMADILNRSFERLRHLRLAQAKVPLPKYKPGADPDVVVASVDAQVGNAPAVIPPIKVNYRSDLKLPVPVKKPIDNDVILAAYAPESGTAGIDTDFSEASTIDSQSIPAEHFEMLAQVLGDNDFSEMMGQGDFDMEAMSRIETGLIAIAAHTGQHHRVPNAAGNVASNIISVGLKAGQNLINGFFGGGEGNADQDVRKVSFQPFPPELPDRRRSPRKTASAWGIYLGESESRDTADRILKNAIQKLEALALSPATAVIVPERQTDNIVFSARLKGYSEGQAKSVCSLLSKYGQSCSVISN